MRKLIRSFRSNLETKLSKVSRLTSCECSLKVFLFSIRTKRMPSVHLFKNTDVLEKKKRKKEHKTGPPRFFIRLEKSSIGYNRTNLQISFTAWETTLSLVFFNTSMYVFQTMWLAEKCDEVNSRQFLLLDSSSQKISDSHKHINTNYKHIILYLHARRRKEFCNRMRFDEEKEKKNLCQLMFKTVGTSFTPTK